MSTRRDEIMPISEAELLAMTSDLQDRHRQTLPVMQERVAEYTETLRDEMAAEEGAKAHRLGRRSFLLGAGALAGGVALAACSSKPSNKTATTGSSTTSTTGGTTGAANDLKVVALATSLENLAVFAYKAGIAAATAGKYGAVPPAVPVFATTAKTQHQDHANAWNAILTGAGKKAVTKTDPAITPAVQSGFAQVKTVPELLALALGLENTAAATYQVGSYSVSSMRGIQVAASIQPVEMQHAAILYFVLGKYPGAQDPNTGKPMSFSSTLLARPVSDYQGAI